MWIQLTSTQNIELRGEMRTFHPGDWIEVGKQFGLLLLSRDQAVAPGIVSEVPVATLAATSRAGAVVPTGCLSAAQEVLKNFSIYEGEPEPCFERTIVWDLEAHVSPGLFTIGLSLLDRWEIAVPLYDYKTLAASVGSEADRELTLRVVHDLRVPLYDIRLIFVKRTSETRRLFHLWKQEPGERKLAFLRVVYKVKPLILALPATWSGWS